MKRSGMLRRRTRLRQRSKTRAAALNDQRRIRLAVFDRDGYRCQAGVLPDLARYSPCFGPLTPHHIRKASQGGRYTMSNLTTLCAHHNDLIEADANFARLCRHYGLVRLRGDG